MATISVSAYNDAASRTAGEAITVTAGAVYTVRTDHRVHINAPASNLGSAAAVTVTEGRYEWDSRNVRWMPFTNSGSAVVPAIGTTISQGGVSGYLLGIWVSKTTAQTAVGDAIPASGFMKFREVTGGAFASGAITGIVNISASGPDVQGWISLPHDTAVDLTVPRLGEFRARGGRFFLENTNGSIGQIFQVPTDGSAAMMAPGLWVETEVTDTYEYWPSLYSATNGWAHQHIGEAAGNTDVRCNFVKALAGGQLQMGESYTQAATYASLAAQASTHAEITHSCTYIWEADLVTVYYATGHLLETGMQTGLDFTSGGATAYDAIYTVTVLSPYHFTIPLAGSGVGGNVTSKPGIQISFTVHGLNIGEQVYCDFTTGTPVDGTYTIYAVPATGTYNIAYPHVAALTSGAVSCLHTLIVTFTSHLLAIGNKVYMDFTSGGATDGEYTVKVVTDANIYRINCPHSAVIATSNVTMRRTIGNVALSGRKTWIPSNILNEVATAARETNTVPAAAAASRPEFITTSAGYIDLEYVYGCSGFASFGQAFNVRIQNCAFFDSLVISECASPLDIDNCNVSMYGALDTPALSLTSNFAGGTITNGKFERGNAPGYADYAASISYCMGISFTNVKAGIVQYARSATSYSVNVAYCSELTFNKYISVNSAINLLPSYKITFNDTNYCDRYNGRTNSTNPWYIFNMGAGCVDVKIEGLIFGFGTIQDCHPYNGLTYYSANSRLKIRNIGSRTAPLNGGTWASNAYGIGTEGYTGGNNNDVKLQRIYVNRLRSFPYSTTNSDKNMLYESVFGGFCRWGTKAPLAIVHADLNGYVKGCQEVNSTTGSPSVYGTHFEDLFIGDERGRIVLPFNEPTTETISVFQMNSGTAKFNSSGGILLTAVGNQCTFTDIFTRYGHTGFERTEALLSGPTQTRFDIHYAIDTGSGFGSFHNLYYQRTSSSGVSGAFTFVMASAVGLEVGDYIFGTGRVNIGRITEINGTTITSDVANSATVSGVLRFNHLPFETIDPAIGFKLKFRLTVITTETVACAFLRVDTLSTLAAQITGLYPLDVINFSLSGLIDGSDVTVLAAGTETVLSNTEENVGSNYTYTYTTPQAVDITIYKPGYIPSYIRNYSLGSINATLPIKQTEDTTYLN
ncbi:hypothetical protein M0R04_05375 [Candidatus Dojkabacteria bacterium]|jgi:hypothetical protein|nr:hypothetical protein [Candidatus Dojkabacteria bacterium]